jgi:hypothetical protein
MKGGCLCGKVRYEITRPPALTAVCHCRHCQRSSGAAFSVNVLIPAGGVAIQGDVSTYVDAGESGNRVLRRFCGACGSALMSELASGMIAVKAGTLDDSSIVAPSVQVWTGSAQSWSADLLKVPGFAANPPAGS